MILGGLIPLMVVVIGIRPPAFNYDQVIYLSILFYEAQRSGALSNRSRIPWRADSAMRDIGWNGEDLTGGELVFATATTTTTTITTTPPPLAWS